MWILTVTTVTLTFISVMVLFVTTTSESVEPVLTSQQSQPREKTIQGRQGTSEQGEGIDVKQLEDDIAKTLECFDNPGLAVAMVKDGKTVLSQGFGVTNPSTKINVTSKTLFSIASLTKAFTAALLVDVMAKNGSVNLSSTVQEVLGPSFRFNDTLRTQYATIEDLLAHRLRVPGNDDFRFNPEIDRQEVLKRVRYFETNSPFRVKGSYSSTNYVMAAAITELIAGKKWEELMNETIFMRLGMTSSSFAAKVDFSHEDVAPPYSTLGGYKANIDPAFTRQWNSFCGSGCIYSTVEDMAKWMHFHLSKGKDSEGNQVFPASQVDDLHSPRSLLPSTSLGRIQKPGFPVTLTASLYALGWRIGEYRGYPIVFHTGSTPGYASILTLIPSQNVGVFIVMNGDDDGYYYRMPLQSYLVDILIGLGPWLNTSDICAFPEPWQRRHTSPVPVYDVTLTPARDWLAYIGVYKNEAYGYINVEFNATVNGLFAGYGFGSWRLYPQKTANEFYAKGLGVTDFFDINPFTFESDQYSGNMITRLVVQGFSSSIPPVFTRVGDPVDSDDTIVG